MAATYKVESFGRRHTIQWTGLTTAGNASIEAVGVRFAAAVAAVQATGTFGSATVALHGSCDGTNFVALSDTDSTTIGLTSAGISEFSTGVAFLKPNVSGGTGDDLDVTVVLWAE